MSRHGRKYNLLPAEQPRQQREAVAVMEAPAKEKVTPEDPDMMREYKTLIAELGVNDSPIKNAEFRAFLAEEGICVYPADKVESYLDKKVKAENKPNLRWVWKPIIGSSVTTAVSISNARLEASGSPFSLGNGWLTFTPAESTGRRVSTVYDKAIPMPVLLTVKRIRDKYPDAQFYASDYEVRNPDPFLMVTGPGLDEYIVERWDEPSFRM